MAQALDAPWSLKRSEASAFTLLKKGKAPGLDGLPLEFLPDLLEGGGSRPVPSVFGISSTKGHAT